MTDAGRSRATATDDSAFRRLPARFSGVIAVALAAGAVVLVAAEPVQRWVLAVALVGVAVFAGGGMLWRRDRSVAIGVVGVAIGVVGTLLVAAALGLALTRPPRYVDRVELLPGLVGLWVLAAGLVPLRLGSERTLVDAGTGLVFLTVLAGGVIQSTPLRAVLLAGVLTMVAWDVAENAVSLGGQLGVAADAGRSEIVHVGGSVAVGAVAVVLVALVNELDVDGLPFAGLIALLVAGVILTLFYNR
ncbi:DUF7519 family protein [Halorubrum sp. DTA98]|uniref:DUF7519 family protein n=1 Tax=Halorubrum sp. DTA98 TaxID=3402163 RepID=UPI003AAAD3FA